MTALPSFAGVRRFAAAVIFHVCAWRADAAQDRAEVWEERAAQVRRWGEGA